MTAPLVVYFVARGSESASCPEVAVEWAELAIRVGPMGIDQVRLDARREITDDHHRGAAEVMIIMVGNAGAGAADLDLDGQAQQVCTATEPPRPR